MIFLARLELGARKSVKWLLGILKEATGNVLPLWLFLHIARNSKEIGIHRDMHISISPSEGPPVYSPSAQISTRNIICWDMMFIGNTLMVFAELTRGMQMEFIVIPVVRKPFQILIVKVLEKAE